MNTRIDRISGGLRREEWLAAAAETAGLLLIFIVAFTGREQFGEAIKTLLVVLSVIVGGLGALAGLAIVRRGITFSSGRVARIALGAFMTFIGAYSIVHVLS